jgi:FkbM family methyltransferase
MTESLNNAMRGWFPSTAVTDAAKQIEQDYNTLTDTRYGQMLVNRHDRYVGKSLLEYGEFSKGEADLFAELVKPGQIVVEVGANIGAHTIHLAQLVGPQGVVIAYEPQRIPFQTLCANVQLNSLANVDAHRAAAGAESGEIIVPELDPFEENNFGGLNILGHRDGSSVPLVSLDATIAHCDFLKLDCEGMEDHGLDGARKLIRRSKPILYVENDRPRKREALIALIESLGYRWEWHLPYLYSSDNWKSNPINHFEGIGS